MAALLFSTALVAAACGSDTITGDTTAESIPEAAAAVDDGAMADDAMEEDAMADDAMEDGDITSNVALEFDGLEPLGDGFVYEGWVIIDGAPVSTCLLYTSPSPRDA